MMLSSYYITPIIWKMRLNKPEVIYAIPNWKKAMPILYLNPNSRLMEDNAATQGVYSKQNIKRQKAE